MPKRVQASNLCPNLEYSEAEVECLFATLDRVGAFDAPGGELSVAFVGKEEIARIHKDFMNDPSPTDVITFHGDSDFDQAGEIIVCPEVAKEYSSKEELDFSRELTLYLIHGYLHLCGFNDIEETDREQMREAEQRALSLVANFMPVFKLS